MERGARRRGMFALVLGAGSIYLLPYMRQSYKLPMCRALGLSATQLGVVSSAFGVAAMASYVPGGWLADQVSLRVLLVLSLLVTGVSGFYWATFPGYHAAVALHLLWGVFTIMTFWPALIRATRELAPPVAQGRAFGLLEGGRGVVESAVAWAGVALFTRMGSEARGLAAVIVTYAAATLGAAVLVWLFWGRDERPAVRPRSTGVRLVLAAGRLPVVWLLAGVILAAYITFWGGFDIASFGEHAFGMSAGFSATLSSYRMAFRVVAPVAAGLAADRIGATRTCVVLFVALALSFALFGVMPTGPGWTWLLWVNTAAAAVGIFGLRGVYYALLEEGGVPEPMTGTATGIISFLGYTPDAFAPVVNGVLLDRFPGALGHRYYYLGIAAVSGLGLAATLGIWRLVRRRACEREDSM